MSLTPIHKTYIHTHVVTLCFKIIGVWLIHYGMKSHMFRLKHGSYSQSVWSVIKLVQMYDDFVHLLAQLITYVSFYTRFHTRYTQKFFKLNLIYKIAYMA